MSALANKFSMCNMKKVTDLKLQIIKGWDFCRMRIIHVDAS